MILGFLTEHFHSLGQAWYYLVEWMWEPESGAGYAFFSSVAGATSFFGIVLYWKHVECHEPGCHRRGKFALPSGVRCCRHHHPDLDKRPEDQRGLVHDLHEKHHARAARHLALVRPTRTLSQ